MYHSVIRYKADTVVEFYLIFQPTVELLLKVLAKCLNGTKQFLNLLKLS